MFRLAAWTEHRGPPAHDNTLQGVLAVAALFAAASVHAQFPLEVARLAVKIREVHEGGAAVFDRQAHHIFAAFQNIAQCFFVQVTRPG